jgi:hypothetical protein
MACIHSSRSIIPGTGDGGFEESECRGFHGMPYKLRLEFPGAVYHVIQKLTSSSRAWR